MKYKILATTEIKFEVRKHSKTCYQSWRVLESGTLVPYGFGPTIKEAIDQSKKLYKKSLSGKKIIKILVKEDI